MSGRYPVRVDRGCIEHLAVCESCGLSAADDFSDKTRAQRWSRAHVERTGHVVAVQAETVTWYRVSEEATP